MALWLSQNTVNISTRFRNVYSRKVCGVPFCKDGTQILLQSRAAHLTSACIFSHVCTYIRNINMFGKCSTKYSQCSALQKSPSQGLCRLKQIRLFSLEKQCTRMRPKTTGELGRKDKSCGVFFLVLFTSQKKLQFEKSYQIAMLMSLYMCQGKLHNQEMYK